MKLNCLKSFFTRSFENKSIWFCPWALQKKNTVSTVSAFFWSNPEKKCRNTRMNWKFFKTGCDRSSFFFILTQKQIWCWLNFKTKKIGRESFAICYSEKIFCWKKIQFIVDVHLQLTFWRLGSKNRAGVKKRKKETENKYQELNLK